MSLKSELEAKAFTGYGFKVVSLSDVLAILEHSEIAKLTNECAKKADLLDALCEVIEKAIVNIYPVPNIHEFSWSYQDVKTGEIVLAERTFVTYTAAIENLVETFKKEKGL